MTRLREERTRRGMTQAGLANLAKLAGAAGINQFRVSQLERGLQAKPCEKVALGNVFGLPPEELFSK
jgi:transcriptional regulator with XRE-family HTH domain